MATEVTFSICAATDDDEDVLLLLWLFEFECPGKSLLYNVVEMMELQ